LALVVMAGCSGASHDEPAAPAAGHGGSAGSAGRVGEGFDGAGPGGHAGTSVMAGMAGMAGNAGRGGQAGSETVGEGGEAGSPATCTTVTTTKQHAQHARSAGFSGTLDQYDEIYDIDCTTTPPCQSACMDRGGTTEMCTDTICSSSNKCLPTPIWTGLTALDAEGTDPIGDSAEIVLWSYPYHDPLLLDQFKLAVPTGAEILGITATIRRAADEADEAVDAGVKLIKNGLVGAADRSLATPWSAPDLVNVDYGGPSDLWGTTWTAEQVNADDFGVSLTVAYTQNNGNGRAYVDIVYVTVTYRTCQ
jgi:hypothetical protein